MEDYIANWIERFKEKIQTNEYENELVEAFKEALYNAIHLMENNRDINTKENKKDSIRFYAEYYINLDIESKKRELLKDKSFEKIRTISNDIFIIACQKLKGKDTKKSEITDLDKKIEQMKKEMEFVKEFNKERARQLFSETLLDVKFIQGKNDGIISLRLKQKKRYMEKEGRE